VLQDVRLVWTNCRLYNSRESAVGKLGIKIEGMWEELWAGSGLATDGELRPSMHSMPAQFCQYTCAPSCRARHLLLPAASLSQNQRMVPLAYMLPLACM
jgi:hypothetical protein